MKLVELALQIRKDFSNEQISLNKVDSTASNFEAAIRGLQIEDAGKRKVATGVLDLG